MEFQIDVLVGYIFLATFQRGGLRIFYDANSVLLLDIDKVILCYCQVASSNIKLIGLQEGTEYVIRIRAQTAAGYGPYSNFYKVKTVSSASLMNPMNKPASKDYSLIYIIAAGAAGAVLLIFVLFTIIRYKRSRKLLCLDLSKEGKKTQHPTSQNGNAQRDPLLSPEELIGKILV